MQHFLLALQKELTHNLFEYLVFATGGVFFLLGLHIFRGERTYEFIILIAFVAFYLIWSMYHHIIDDTLHFRVVIEYVLIGFTILFLFKILLIS